MKCVYHNERDAEYVCTTCGQPVCRECATAVNGKNVCKSCAHKATQYNVVPYNNVPYKRGDGINGFLFFIFLVAPGIRHMYLGLMKRGFEFLVAFFGSIAIAMLLGNNVEDIFIPVFFVIWFYSAFDSYHCRKLIARGEEVEDSPIFKDYNIGSIRSFFEERKQLTGISIMVLGFLLLLRKFRMYTWKFRVPQEILTVIDLAFDSIIPVLLIAGGVYLLSRYKKRNDNTVESE